MNKIVRRILIANGIVIFLLALFFIAVVDNWITPVRNGSIAHFSVDDTINIFIDLTNHSYDSIFENETLNFFRCMHEQYGGKVTFYCYYEKLTKALI